MDALISKGIRSVSLSVSGDIALKYGPELKTIIGNHRTILRTGWSNWQDYLSIHVPGNLAANATPKIHIRSNGNVGIGTTSPGSRLTVKGNIHAEEVKVDLNVPGPDYVFDEDYELSSLEEVEKYIQENKHLPEIPSAADMEKTGIYLSEMNMKLLKKVEELTLHMIDLHHEMKRLSKENELYHCGEVLVKGISFIAGSERFFRKRVSRAMTGGPDSMIFATASVFTLLL